MTARDAARAWVEAWTRGWHAHDPEPIVARYSERCVFRSHPFRDPEDVRAYVERVLAEEDAEPDVWFGEPVTDGDRTAVEYWAVIRVGGREQTLAGVSVLRFDPQGLVVEHRDYWALEEGRRRRPGRDP